MRKHRYIGLLLLSGILLTACPGKVLHLPGSEASGLPLLVKTRNPGMHSDSLLLHSSESIRKAFFDHVLARMVKEERFRAAFVFQLVDCSPAAIAVFNGLFEPGVPASFINQYAAVPACIGLLDYGSGKRRKAWKSIMESIRSFR